MKKITILSLLLIFSVLTFGQSKKWKSERQSLVFATGTNHFMGELGGGKKDAAHFMGIRDMDFVNTRPTGQFAYRYRLSEYFSFRANLSYALLSGKDAASGEEGRKSRNLRFTSHIFELSGQLEYYFIKEKESPRYSFSSLRSTRNISAYVFVGFGGFYHNPRAKWLTEDGGDGKWYNLRPLGTEGQKTNITYSYFDYAADNTEEITTTDKYYGKFAAVIPMGIGMKYNLNKNWAIGLEISNRYSSTDYIDDASDRYFNYNEMYTRGLVSEPTPQQVYFSDRHLPYASDGSGGTTTPYLSGKPMRGDPSFNDAYVLTLVTLHYKIKKGGSSKPKFK